MRDTSKTDGESRTATLERVPFLLRLLAFVLVPVGFIGFVTTDTTPFDTNSVFTIVFVLGIGCAVVSIYLGIYLQRPGDL